MRCCKIVKVCKEKKCRHKNVWCKWKGTKKVLNKHLKCIMVPIRQNRFIVVKRKRCTSWIKSCTSKKRM